MEPLQDAVCNQLIAQGRADQRWALVLLAALDGDATLAGYLDGMSTVSAPVAPATSDASNAPAGEPCRRGHAWTMAARRRPVAAYARGTPCMVRRSARIGGADRARLAEVRFAKLTV